MASSWMKKGSLGLATMAMATTALLTACGGGGGGGGGSYSADPYYQPWYDVYGTYCGSGSPAPGCNFYANGLKIIDFEDPYFNSSYYLSYDAWTYYDSYGFPSSYVGWGWTSPTGILYDDFGNALNSQDGKGRDFAADVAKAEKTAVKTVGEQFSAKYQLDKEVGYKVARLLKDWAVIGKDRARTERDINAFTKKLYGIDVNKVKGALAEASKGEKAPLEGLVDEAATNWSTTPETMKEILKTWYGKQVGDLY